MIKHMVQIESGRDYKEFASESGGYPVYGTGGVFAYCSKYLFGEGESVLLGRKGTVDKPLFASGPFWTSDTIYYTVAKSNITPKFFFYLVARIPFDLFVYGSAIPSMSKTDYEEMKLPLPPKSEQSQIVSYLDRKTALIDSLIEKTERKIELLKEKRTALINQAVTKGLDPNVKMKDSGVEWIGEIPESWEVTKLKYLSEILNGYAFKSDDYTDHGVPVVRIGDVKEPIDFNNAKRVPNSIVSKLQSYRLQRSDILIAMTGATIGKIGKFDTNDECYLNQRVGALRSFVGSCQDFLWLILSSDIFKEYVRLECDGGAQENIGREELGNFTCVVPEYSEQKSISEIATAQLARIKSMTSLEEKKVDKLKEYRQALISEVVTGKRKVTQDD
ncbi:MAG: restriction endonuclease subunit S [Oceanospirillaceae bacterium]|nr:restriction endonuclease subunit S [Oceanospirillaceae bacterium]